MSLLGRMFCLPAVRWAPEALLEDTAKNAERKNWFESPNHGRTLLKLVLRGYW